ncbi:hypothetical protein SSP531S_02100 [Streptomyces spongiicola]|uniref:Uncharacterized protein n=1 Tax=Streptomyces spongiicola TaxID=1690221 RepID=A0A388SQ98_9ACTN|nr:hypothetical protein SSP531S_02100 [Streptomyces spongiicola]
MALIAEFRTTAQPDRGIVEVYDADAYEADCEAAAKARSEVVAGNGYHLCLRTLQPDLRIEIAVRIWDGPSGSSCGLRGPHESARSGTATSESGRDQEA